MIRLRDYISGDNNLDTHRIPIHPELKELLLNLARSSNYVFPSKYKNSEVSGEQWSDIKNTFNKSLREAGITRKIRFHDLRHTFASNFIMSGGNILTLQKLLGHSTMNLTMRYAHLAPDFMENEIQHSTFRFQMIVRW